MAMTQYIDKSSIITEIRRLLHNAEAYLKYHHNKNDELVHSFKHQKLTMCELLSFIDSLEVKEVNLDKEIKNRIDNLSNLYCYMEDLFNGKEEEGVHPIPENVINELFEFAKYFFEIGLKKHKKRR